MPNPSPGYANNIVRRALHAILDPEPTPLQVTQIWVFFESRCAYCRTKLVRKDRTGHIDHLVARAEGGPNHVSNRVLACRTCNSDEKLDSDWQAFLSSKVVSKKRLAQRKKRIKQWVSENVPPPSFDRELIESETNNVIETFDNSVERIKRAR